MLSQVFPKGSIRTSPERTPPRSFIARLMSSRKAYWEARCSREKASRGVSIARQLSGTNGREAFRDQEIQAVQHGYLASDLTHWEFRLGRWATEDVPG
jgi:hypothetical protein